MTCAAASAHTGALAFVRIFCPHLLPASKSQRPSCSVRDARKREENYMLAHAQLTTILPVLDLERARAFYEGKLGLLPEGARPDGKFIYACGDARLALFPRASGTKADHTAVKFQGAGRDSPPRLRLPGRCARRSAVPAPGAVRSRPFSTHFRKIAVSPSQGDRETGTPAPGSVASGADDESVKVKGARLELFCRQNKGASSLAYLLRRMQIRCQRKPMSPFTAVRSAEYGR